MPDDLGFAKLLDDDGLFAHLLGKTRSGRKRALLYGPDLPVVLLAGGPGMGKTALLKAVQEGFGREVPVAYLDCGVATFAERAARNPTVRTELTEALREIGLQLRAWSGIGGGIAVPRLYAGLQAAAAGDPDEARSVLAGEVARQDDLRPAASFWRGVGERSALEYLSAVAELVTGPLTGPFVTAVLQELFKWLSPQGKAALTGSYGRYQGAAHNPDLGLHLLAGDFHRGGEATEAAEGFLLRALREDVEAAYASSRGRWTRVGRPALLLDRADNALGRAILKAVLADREKDVHDRLVVVATARRDDGGVFLYRKETDTAVRWSPSGGPPPDWRRADRDGARVPAPVRGVLLVSMPPLDTSEAAPAVPLTGGADRIHANRAIHSLSGGRPAMMTRLWDAAVTWRAPGDDATAWSLLEASLPVGDARRRPVADVLLEELVVGQPPETLAPRHRTHWLDLLTHLSIAHDGECAEAIARERQDGRDDRLRAVEIAGLLEDCGWPRCPRHFIGDFGLRHLLLRRLYHLRPDGRAWHADHALLQGHYDVPAEDHPDPLFGSATTHRLHHRFASDGVDSVVDHLTGTFGAGDVRDWIAGLLAITDVPLLGGLGDVKARALGEAPVAGEPMRRHVDRLLHAVWLYQDWTRPHDAAVVEAPWHSLELLTSGLTQSSEERTSAVLNKVLGEWKQRVDNRQPLRPCACTRHIG